MTASVERTITRVPFSAPDITDAEIEAVVDVLRSGWLTSGPKVEEFQRAFSKYVGASHAVALNSATAALHLALDAIEVNPADEVIVPTYTFAASAEVIRYFGARPVLVDVRPDDLNLDVAAVERAIGPNTRAVVGVDLAGQPCDWHLLRPLAERHGFALVDDAAHALPSSLRGRAIGCWADVTAFSFYPTKPLTTGEGGMLVTENESWATRAQRMSLHGVSRDAWNRYGAEGTWYYEIIAPGFKYNMTDIAAALGLVQLRRLDEMNRRRASIAEQYTAALESFAELEVPSIRADRSTSWHLYILRLNLDRLRCDRAEFIDALDQEQVGTSVHFIPLHRHPYYRDTYGYTPSEFPVADREYQRVVSLPIYSRMTDEDVDRVIGAIGRIVAANRRPGR
jgi:dTDP-4-amino-4,6-dideoxygalactose transaminase